jgi:hypothetical protein
MVLAQGVTYCRDNEIKALDTSPHRTHTENFSIKHYNRNRPALAVICFYFAATVSKSLRITSPLLSSIPARRHVVRVPTSHGGYRTFNDLHTRFAPGSHNGHGNAGATLINHKCVTRRSQPFRHASLTLGAKPEVPEPRRDTQPEEDERFSDPGSPVAPPPAPGPAPAAHQV